MLFQLDKKNQIILRPEAIQLVPAFKKLDSDEMLFVILFMDYHSPYHQFPDRERLEKSLRHVYKTRNKKIEKHVKDACNEYASLQYDERRVTIEIYQQKIHALQSRLEATEEEKDIISYMNAIDKLQAKCEDLQRQINFDEQANAVLYGREGKSMIELLQENKKLSEMREESTLPSVKILYQPRETGEGTGKWPLQ